MNWRTPTRLAAGTASAGRTCSSCSTRGIDVYTTLNVQHVESLNDVVAQITGVTVRETVPDAVLERADEIELVDVSPDVLLQRLREGRVYLPDQASRALERFFREGNLIALRELALRQTAHRVDAQMRGYMRSQGIRDTWAASDRLAVCIGADPSALRLVRAARRMAERLQAQWTAVFVEVPGQVGEDARDAVVRGFRLAEELGGETVTLSGASVADEILAWARERQRHPAHPGEAAASRASRSLPRLPARCTGCRKRQHRRLRHHRRRRRLGAAEAVPPPATCDPVRRGRRASSPWRHGVRSRPAPRCSPPPTSRCSTCSPRSSSGRAYASDRRWSPRC